MSQAENNAELFKEIRKIEIHTRRLVNDQLAGQYQSVFKGGACRLMKFANTSTETT